MSWTREFLLERLVIDLGILTVDMAKGRSTKELGQIYWNYQEKERIDTQYAQEEDVEYRNGDDW